MVRHSTHLGAEADVVRSDGCWSKGVGRKGAKANEAAS